MRRNTKRVLTILLAAALVLGMFPAAVFGGEGFQDVNNSDWYYDSVTEMAEDGLMNGVGDGTFDPTGDATRGMLVTVIWRMEGCVKPSHGAVCRFPDVTEDWNKTAIMWITDGGTAIEGYPDGTFKPNKVLTRAEAAKIIGFAASNRLDRCETEETPVFADQDQIPEWAKPWVEKCQCLGIISGYEDGTFRPDQTITRAELAKMLGVMKKLEKHTVPPVPIREDYDPNAKTDAMIEAIVGDTKDNYLISPLSLKAAFALAANGAEGETQQEILDSLGMGNLGQFNDYMKDRKEKYGKAADAITIDLNNSIWVNESRTFGADFREDYKLLLDDFYSAEAGKVNDSNAVSTINGWISEKTRGKISSVLDSSAFTTCLVNTLYFKGAWTMPFNKHATQKGTFTNADGTQKQTDLMHLTEDIQYYSKDGVQMIRLPYENLVRDENGKRKGDGPFVTASMYIVLSEEPVELAKLIDEARDEMSVKLVAVTLPKFTFKWNGELNTALQQLGINKAFTEAAEFDPMSELPQCISQVLQSTFIAVDEEGTEAAAATVILSKSTTALDPKVPIPFTADHPFRFAIVDDDSHEVLFAGAYNKVE
ncbi:MAG: S-layer homology domain-containing protein [Firmicutes bacterium]|nr:S-layer homology domain-containing protein [Bacillota bacterium]